MNSDECCSTRFFSLMNSTIVELVIQNRVKIGQVGAGCGLISKDEGIEWVLDAGLKILLVCYEYP